MVPIYQGEHIIAGPLRLRLSVDHRYWYLDSVRIS